MSVPSRSVRRRRLEALRALVVTGIVVAIVSTVWLATWRTKGDFSATLPGGYAERLNPTLWNSPDLRESWAFHKNTYLHGPVQYLTLYPIVFLDSYAAIAWVLLPIYGAVIYFTVRRLLAALAMLADRRALTFPVLAMTCVFIPLLQGYVHREFEVVVLLMLCWALHAVLTERYGVAGAMLAYVAWFKYIPLMFLGYLGFRGWKRGVIAFVVASVVILAAAHLLFGLPNFANNNVPGHAAAALGLRGDFCEGWSGYDETTVSVRHGLCRLQTQLQIPLARSAYLALTLLIAIVYLVSHVRISRRGLERPAERWRAALEFSIVTAVYATWFFGHYYYLSALLVPFGVLLARNLMAQEPRRWILWGLAYFFISASAMPTALLSWLLHAETWHVYMRVPMYLYGELLLIGLLLWEYWQVGDRAPEAQPV